jgi:hypothetical protein
MGTTVQRVAALIGALALVVAVAASVTSAAPRSDGKPDRVESKTDPAAAKLDDELQQKVDAGATAKVPVFVTTDDAMAAQVKALLEDAHAASRNGHSIVIGRIAIQKLLKLASFDGVQSVGAVSYKATNTPNEDPLVPRVDRAAMQEGAKKLYFRRAIPYDKAPPLAGSHLDELKNLPVLDAKTHEFAEAWKAASRVRARASA